MMKTDSFLVIWIYFYQFSNCFGKYTLQQGMPSPLGTPRVAAGDCSQGLELCDFHNGTCGYTVANSTGKAAVSSSEFVFVQFRGTPSPDAGSDLLHLLVSPCLYPDTYNLTFQYDIVGSASLAVRVRISSNETRLVKNLTQTTELTWTQLKIQEQRNVEVVFVATDTNISSSDSIYIDDIKIAGTAATTVKPQSPPTTKRTTTGSSHPPSTTRTTLLTTSSTTAMPTTSATTITTAMTSIITNFSTTSLQTTSSITRTPSMPIPPTVQMTSTTVSTTSSPTKSTTFSPSTSTTSLQTTRTPTSTTTIPTTSTTSTPTTSTTSEVTTTEISTPVASTEQPSVAECADPIPPDNGEVDVVHPGNSSSIANYSCHKGYNMISTNGSIITCLPSGTWPLINVTCRIKDCRRQQLPYITNGNISARATTYGSTAYIACDNNFILEGRNLIKCTAEGTWESYGATCIRDLSKIRCRANTDRRGTHWPETKRNEVVVKECGTYQDTLTGEIKRRCDSDGNWHLPNYDCVSKKLEEIESKVDDLKKNQSAELVEDVLSTLSNTTSDAENAEPMFDGELKKVTTILETIATVSSKIQVSEEQSQEFINTASNLLDVKNQQTWEAIAQTEDEEKEENSGAAKVLDVVDTYATAIATTLVKSNVTMRTVENKNMALRVVRVDETNTENVHFPDDEVQTIHTKSTIELKANQLQGVTSYSAIVYQNLTGILSSRTAQETKEEQTINSVVLSLDLHGTSGALDIPVIISLEHFDKALGNPACSFWNMSLNAWDSHGCILTRTNSSISVCQCSHLTNFAILMSPWTEENVMSKAIDIISTVGCSVSLAALIITMMVHFYLWRYLESDRTIILMNLSIALAASYVVFLAGIDRTENKGTCMAIAAILQYIYLAVFCLMLVEGIELAITVLYVFKTRSRLKWMLPLAWGSPAVIVGISLGVTRLKGYGNDTFCWLSVDSGIIWGFFGPAICVILINAVLLILIIRTVFRAKSISEKSNAGKAKVGVKSLCVLLPLLGCTWVLGMFYVNEDFAWMQYMFAVCNSLQGLVIFLFHCAFNPQIMIAIKRKKRRYLASRTETSDSANQLAPQNKSTTSFNGDDYHSFGHSSRI